MNKRNIAATLQCFIKRDGKYLMLRRNLNKRIMPGVWMAPGGKREINEGLYEAARREVMEETGLKIKNLRIMITGSGHLKDIDQELFFHWLEADYAGGEVHQDPEDGELKWLTPAEIGELDNLLAELKAVLPYLFKHDGSIVSYIAEYDQGNHMTRFEIENPD